MMNELNVITVPDEAWQRGYSPLFSEFTHQMLCDMARAMGISNHLLRQRVEVAMEQRRQQLIDALLHGDDSNPVDPVGLMSIVRGKHEQ